MVRKNENLASETMRWLLPPLPTGYYWVDHNEDTSKASLRRHLYSTAGWHYGSLMLNVVEGKVRWRWTYNGDEFDLADPRCRESLKQAVERSLL